MKASPRDPDPRVTRPSPRFDVVALAASAGGIHALGHVISGLTDSFPAALVVVLHLDPDHPSHLSEILGRKTSVIVQEARDGLKMVRGHAYVAPPDRHLLVNPDGTLSLTRAELVHFVRPSADLLFESVAAAYGDRAIAVVLSGTGVDGASGVRAVRKRGGVVLAQDEESSEFFGMPDAAIKTGDVSRILPLDGIAPALVDLLDGRVPA